MLEEIIRLIVKLLGLILPSMVLTWVFIDFIDYLRNRLWNREDTLGYTLLFILVFTTMLAILW